MLTVSVILNACDPVWVGVAPNLLWHVVLLTMVYMNSCIVYLLLIFDCLVVMQAAASALDLLTLSRWTAGCLEQDMLVSC